MPSIKISSALENELLVVYRYNGVLREKRLQAYALNNEISFANNDELEAFRASAKSYYERGLLQEGRASEGQIAEANETNTKEQKGVIFEKTDKAIDNLEAGVGDTIKNIKGNNKSRAKVKINVENS